MTGIDWFLSVASSTSDKTDPARGCFWIAAQGFGGGGTPWWSDFARRRWRRARALLTFTEDKAVVNGRDGRQLVAKVDDKCRAFARREPVGAPGERVSLKRPIHEKKGQRRKGLTRS